MISLNCKNSMKQNEDISKKSVSSKIILKSKLKQLEKEIFTIQNESERKQKMFEMARIYLEIGKAQKAVEILNDLLKSSNGRNLPHVNHYLGQAYYKNSGGCSSVCSVDLKDKYI